MARGSRYRIAQHCWKDQIIKGYLLKLVGATLHGEIATMCSDRADSLLKSQSVSEDLPAFQWGKLEAEMQVHAPTLTSLLHACFKTRVPRQNLQQMVCLCAALMCKHRRPTMCLLQKIISIILYNGHCSKQVYVIYIYNNYTCKLCYVRGEFKDTWAFTPLLSSSCPPPPLIVTNAVNRIICMPASLPPPYA